jgi:RNA polymerase sigma-70 factor (ECF subfamily)
LQDEERERLPDRFGFGPADRAEAAELLAAIRQAVDETLTVHQRRMFVAVVVNGVPLDALVAQLGVNRNAIYKAVFDARRKIRAVLVANGLLADGGTEGRA